MVLRNNLKRYFDFFVRQFFLLHLVANNRGVRISGRRGLENLGQVCILVLKKIACFLLQIRLVYSLQNNSHFKYNKEVIGFHLLSFFFTACCLQWKFVTRQFLNGRNSVNISYSSSNFCILLRKIASLFISLFRVIPARALLCYQSFFMRVVLPIQFGISSRRSLSFHIISPFYSFRWSQTNCYFCSCSSIGLLHQIFSKGLH